MGVTATLLDLYRVDQQLRGLTSRLDGAEKYLAEQDRQLKAIAAKQEAAAAQLKQLEASAHNDQSEASGIDARIETLRERMNNAKTSKEHSALLTEMNTLKADKTGIEERALASMQKLEELRKQVETTKEQKAEREQVRKVALKDRDERKAEIQQRLDELNAQRLKAVDEVPPEPLRIYTERLNSGAEDVMAPLQEEDRRNLEYSCGSCYTMLPIELVSILLKRGDLTKCPSCKVILYMETELKQDIATSQEKKKSGTKTPKAPKGTKKSSKK